MGRSGVYVKQTTGYRAFIPTPLPPKPAVKIEGELQNLLSHADMALARLDGEVVQDSHFGVKCCPSRYSFFPRAAV